jgi:hypothetical protein
MASAFLLLLLVDIPHIPLRRINAIDRTNFDSVLHITSWLNAAAREYPR